jgi:hypothetical protein
LYNALLGDSYNERRLLYRHRTLNFHGLTIAKTKSYKTISGNKSTNKICPPQIQPCIVFNMAKNINNKSKNKLCPPQNNMIKLK